MHRKGNVVKRFNKLAGELFENAAVAYTLEQYEKCKEKIKDFGPGLYNDLTISCGSVVLRSNRLKKTCVTRQDDCTV